MPTGDSLTIDDSTNAAARACTLAREAGHEVTLFINPAQIARQRQYWFSRLDVILAQCTMGSVVLDDQEFDLSPGRPLRVFRRAVKARLSAIDEAQTDELLNELASKLNICVGVVPEHAQTMSLDTVRGLVERGVRIQSHGWDHRDISSLTPEELVEDLQRSADWFQSYLGIRPDHYAVPFGLPRLPDQAAQEVTGMILLADPKLPTGFLGERHWNRRDIASDLQGSFS
jgi:hypothetical protein